MRSCAFGVLADVSMLSSGGVDLSSGLHNYIYIYIYYYNSIILWQHKTLQMDNMHASCGAGGGD